MPVTNIATEKSGLEKTFGFSEPSRRYAELLEGGSSSPDTDEDRSMLMVHFDDVVAAIDDLCNLGIEVGQSAQISRWITGQMTCKQSQ